jgi:serine protease Do
MSHKKILIPIIAVVLAFGAGIALSLVLLRAGDRSKLFIDACTLAKPSVVGITVVTAGAGMTGTDFHRFGVSFPRYRSKNRSYASGVVIDREGYIVTNHHVVEHAQNGDITVTLMDGREFKARVAGTDPGSDIAIIKVDATDLPVASLGNSDEIVPGQLVMTIGNPFGLSHSVSLGIVSATGRRNVGPVDLEDYIQTDAAINPGNSGGPVINLKGEVIGIAWAMASRTGRYQGVGFAIPINMVTRIKQKLITEGRAPRGWLGVHLQDLSPSLAKSFGLENSTGVLVTQVTEGSPSQAAGIRVEDILLSYNGKPIEDIGHLQVLVGRTRVSDKARITVFRKGARIEAVVTIGDYDLAMARVPRGKGFGVKAAELTADDIRRWRYSGHDGIIVTEVTPNGPAARAGLTPGMLIQKINKHTIRNMDDYEKMEKEIAGAKVLRLRVRYMGRIQYLTLTR